MTITFKTIQNSELRIFRRYLKPKKTAIKKTVTKNVNMNKNIEKNANKEKITKKLNRKNAKLNNQKREPCFSNILECIYRSLVRVFISAMFIHYRFVCVMA